MNKRVLLINRGSDTHNIGDEAINYSLKKMFENNSAQVDCENYTLFYNRNGSKAVSAIRNFKKAISVSRRNYDIVIIGGGQLILSNKSFPVSFFLWTLILKIFSNSKIYLFGVGVVDDFSSIEKKLISIGLKKVKGVYVRDVVSNGNLKKIFNVNSEVIPDPVFGISELFQPTLDKTNNILFGITTYTSIKRYGYLKESEEEYLINQANYVLEISENQSVKLIYNTQDDYKYTLKLKDLLQSKFNFEIDVLETKSLEAYLNIVSNAKKIISSRMHALIIARSYGVKIEPIVRNKKLKTFKAEHDSISIEDAYERNNNTIKFILDDN